MRPPVADGRGAEAGKGRSVSRSPSSPLRPAPGRRSRSRRVPIAEAGGRRRGAHPERDGSRESRGGSRRRSPTGSGATWIGSGIGLAERRYGARRGCAGAGGRPSAPRPPPLPCRWRSASPGRAGAADALGAWATKAPPLGPPFREHDPARPEGAGARRRPRRARARGGALGAPIPPLLGGFSSFRVDRGAWRRRHGRANPIRPSSLGRAARPTRPTRAWAHERWSSLGEAPARAGPVEAAEAANLEIAPHRPTRKRRNGRAARVAAARMGNGVHPLPALRPTA